MQVDPENRGSQFKTDFDKPIEKRCIDKKEKVSFGRFFVDLLIGFKNFLFGHKKSYDLPQVDLSSRNASPQKITMNWMSDESSESSLSPKPFLPVEESVSSYDRQGSTDSGVSVSSFSTFKGEGELPVGYSDQSSKGLLNSQVSDDQGVYNFDGDDSSVFEENEFLHRHNGGAVDDDFPPPPTPEELNEPFELDTKPSRTPDEAWEDARKPGSFSSFLPESKVRAQGNSGSPAVPERPDVDKKSGQVSKLQAKNKKNLRLEIPERKDNPVAQPGENRKGRPVAQPGENRKERPVTQSREEYIQEMIEKTRKQELSRLGIEESRGPNTDYYKMNGEGHRNIARKAPQRPPNTSAYGVDKDGQRHVARPAPKPPGQNKEHGAEEVNGKTNVVQEKKLKTPPPVPPKPKFTDNGAHNRSADNKGVRFKDTVKVHDYSEDLSEEINKDLFDYRVSDYDLEAANPEVAKEQEEMELVNLIKNKIDASIFNGLTSDRIMALLQSQYYWVFTSDEMNRIESLLSGKLDSFKWAEEDEE